MTASIAGIGAYVPETIVTNDDLAKIVETSDEWITSRTGIRERRISTGEETSDLAAEAARRALAAAGVKAEDLDLIIMGTSSPDCNYPSGACEVQAKIGAVNAAAFDVSAACAGFIFAMNIVQGFFKSGIYQTALVIGAETLSKVTDWTDRSTCVLFGDGAGAAVLKNEKTGILDMLMGSDGTKGEALMCKSRTLGNFLTGTKPEIGFMTMDGQEVFRFAVKRVPESIETLMKRNHMEKDDIRYYVLHQANERIVEAVARRLKEPMDKFPMTIAKYGNTSTASIPLLLNDMVEQGMLKDGDKIIMSGFGAGMTWGAVLLEWKQSV
ncbi:MAG: ketoacyl-ACP synthase III [Lachnospiraceae bacterium]|nr:ketoacyl-ACP synthase III [Lachnospiraceae bacterium]